MQEVSNQPYKRMGTTEATRNKMGMPMMQKAHSQNPQAAIDSSALNLAAPNSVLDRVDKSVGGLTEVLEVQAE